MNKKKQFAVANLENAVSWLMNILARSPVSLGYSQDLELRAGKRKVILTWAVTPLTEQEWEEKRTRRDRWLSLRSRR
jgi:hypothetical protein